MISSCSIQKRVYRKGYHVVWDHKKSDEHKRSERIVEEKPVPATEIQEVVVVSRNATIESGSIFIEKKPVLVFGKDTCGDVLYLKNGEKINAKVLEVDRSLIKYRRCDNLDGPLFTIRKSSIAMLQYSNGMKENLEMDAEQEQVIVYKNSPPPRKQNALGITSFVCAVSGFLLGFPFLLAMPFAFISLSQFKKFPDKYEDRWMPKTALVISAVIYLLCALILGLVAFLSWFPELMVAAAVTFILGILSIVPLVIYK